MTDAKETILIKLADFTTHPGGRYRIHHKVGSNGSAEAFRDDVLDPAFLKAVQEGKMVAVNFEGIVGVTASYLEEVFGGLARKYGVEAVTEVIRPEAEKPHHQKWVEEANLFILEEGKRQAGEMPFHQYLFVLGEKAQRFQAHYDLKRGEDDAYPKTRTAEGWWELFTSFESEGPEDA